MNKIDYLKFIWAYMIEEGRLTTGQWEYYLGNWIPSDGMYFSSSAKDKVNYDSLVTDIQTIGIDWEKTKPPISSMQSAFTDSFNPSAECETLLGELYLNDGSMHKIGVNNAEKRFSEYVKALSHMMEDEARILSVLGQKNV